MTPTFVKSSRLGGTSLCQGYATSGTRLACLVLGEPDGKGVPCGYQPKPGRFSKCPFTIRKYRTKRARMQQSTSSERFTNWLAPFPPVFPNPATPACHGVALRSRIREGRPQVAFRLPRSGMAKGCGKPAMMARRRDRRNTTVCAGPEDAASATLKAWQAQDLPRHRRGRRTLLANEMQPAFASSTKLYHYLADSAESFRLRHCYGLALPSASW